MVNPLSRSFSSLLEGNVSAVRCGGLGGFSHMKKGNIKRIFHPQKYHGTSQKTSGLWMFLLFRLGVFSGSM